MALLLLHKSFDGEPMGAWSDDGESYYAPEFEEFKARGEQMLSVRGWQVPWSVYVDTLAGYTNQREWWAPLDSGSQSIEAAVQAARTKFFSDRNAEVKHDH